MKLATLLIAVTLTAAPMQAAPADITVRAWYDLKPNDQLASLADAVIRIEKDVAKTDPALALKIRAYYHDKDPGAKTSRGTEKLLKALRLYRAFAEDRPENERPTILGYTWTLTDEKIPLPPRTKPAR